MRGRKEEKEERRDNGRESRGRRKKGRKTRESETENPRAGEKGRKRWC